MLYSDNTHIHIYKRTPSDAPDGHPLFVALSALTDNGAYKWRGLVEFVRATQEVTTCINIATVPGDLVEGLVL